MQELPLAGGLPVVGGLIGGDSSDRTATGLVSALPVPLGMIGSLPLVGGLF